MDSDKSKIKGLLKKYSNRTISKRELYRLKNILKEDNSEQEIKLLLEEHWREFSLSKNNIEDDGIPDLFQNILETAKERERAMATRRFQWNKVGSVAAVFIGLIVLSGILYFVINNDRSSSSNLMVEQTDIGERKTIALPDGSTVMLNSNSELKYPEFFGSSTRSIALRGEAFFEVMRNESVPFVVSTGELETQVLGTSFNVKAYSEDKKIKVSVATGKVKVSNQGKLSDQEKDSFQKHEEVILLPNQQVVYQADSQDLVKEENVNLSALTAWRDGVLVFEQTKLREVINTLERNYAVDIRLLNPSIADCSIRGRHDKQSIEDILRTLQFVLDIEYEIDGTLVTISEGNCNEL